MFTKMKLFFTAVLFALFSAPAFAQDTPYTWEAGDISLLYPAGWDEPLPDDSGGVVTLRLAQTLVDAPDVRPPGIPIITLKVLPSAAADLPALLEAELRLMSLDSLSKPSESTLLGAEAVEITGSSADGSLFGVGRAAAISATEVLIVTGRAQAAQREAFTAVYTALIDSLTTNRAPAVRESGYGVLWHTMRTLAEGEEAFLNLVGLAFVPSNRLYTYERDLGLVELDAVSGEVLSLMPNPEITAPADVAADADGTVYVADVNCGCIFVRGADGTDTWSDTPITGFGDGAPASLAVGSDNRLYATNVEDNSSISVRVLQNGALERTLALDPGVFQQPLLAADQSGRVLALIQYGEALSLAGAAPTPLFDLGPLPESLTDFALDSENNIILTTAEFGIMILNAQGEEIDRPGRIVPSFPLAGEFVSPGSAAVGTDGTLYFVDSDGSFGAVTAMSRQVARGRIGATALALNLAVQGTLDESAPQQTWTYDGQAGQRVTISALDASGANQLDLALRLIAPDGSEEAYNDDQAGEELPAASDAQVIDHPLATSGTYIIVVQRIDGEGAYRLGISETQMFTLGANGVTTLNGEISDVFPVQRWQFEGQAGQTLTITMQATSGTLDPALRLVAANGEVIAGNDDADDPALGTNAQIFAARLPENGRYTVEAGRFEGEGRYELVIVVIA